MALTFCSDEHRMRRSSPAASCGPEASCKAPGVLNLKNNTSQVTRWMDTCQF
ncbi:hypothetical protein [Streptomyces europaeiscabiei]|uniref:hypothetical protein n=1 Tax=Streptomyces europaeiscabiei TaxID=146819 RepID=UPI002E1672FF|nr:hypothetical protein OHB30_05005 [Streptomyces europaeiscabiei]